MCGFGKIPLVNGWIYKVLRAEGDCGVSGTYALKNRHTYFFGYGSQAFANPDFTKDRLSEGTLVSGKIYIMCSKCMELMRSMLQSDRVVRGKAYAQLFQQYKINNG